MCKNLTVSHRLIDKQITSNRNFGISKVCNMDQEAEIFIPKATQNGFLTRSTARGRAWRTMIEAAILEGRWSVFFSYWWVIITLVLCFPFGGNNTQTSIKAAKIVTLKSFSSSTNFDPGLRLAHINCFTICFYKLLYNLLENICNTNHKSISR